VAGCRSRTVEAGFVDITAASRAQQRRGRGRDRPETYGPGRHPSIGDVLQRFHHDASEHSDRGVQHFLRQQGQVDHPTCPLPASDSPMMSASHSSNGCSVSGQMIPRNRPSVSYVRMRAIGYPACPAADAKSPPETNACKGVRQRVQVENLWRVLGPPADDYVHAEPGERVIQRRGDRADKEAVQPPSPSHRVGTVDHRFVPAALPRAVDGISFRGAVRQVWITDQVSRRRNPISQRPDHKAGSCGRPSDRAARIRDGVLIGKPGGTKRNPVTGPRSAGPDPAHRPRSPPPARTPHLDPPRQRRRRAVLVPLAQTTPRTRAALPLCGAR
jgi:hypothetical protein